jgi:signal transduction histidine kinase
MRSLTTKLILAFLLVGLTGAVLVALIVRFRTQRAFDQLVVNQNQQLLLVNLAEYYRRAGSWAGVETVFRPGANLPGLGSIPEARWEARRALFVVANAQGVVLFGGEPHLHGRTLTARELRKGIRIEVNGDTVGWLIFSPALDRWRAGTPEGDFLLSVNRGAYLSAIAATGIALILGGVLAYGLTRSLRELTSATQALAQGELGRQVTVHSNDELGALAASFNQMSTALARSTELRRQMTANIAHDLRSPLAVIQGYAEALTDGKLQPSQEIFTVMHTEALHLSRLIDDLKTLSLAEARELPLMPQQVSPDALLRRAVESFRVQAEGQGITLEMQAEENLPEVRVDVERMAQVLGNLMRNALRYTPGGGRISLSARRAEQGVLLQVADTGTGISPEDLPYIFERTYRGNKARSADEGETGLGLAIARSLVEAQGGKISVESRPGEGSVFTIWLRG